jgi:hypothetical protein
MIDPAAAGLAFVACGVQREAGTSWHPRGRWASSTRCAVPGRFRGIVVDPRLLAWRSLHAVCSGRLAQAGTHVSAGRPRPAARCPGRFRGIMIDTLRPLVASANAAHLARARRRFRSRSPRLLGPFHGSLAAFSSGVLRRMVFTRRSSPSGAQLRWLPAAPEPTRAQGGEYRGAEDLGGRGRRHDAAERRVIRGRIDEAVAAGARREAACKLPGLTACTLGYACARHSAGVAPVQRRNAR